MRRVDTWLEPEQLRRLLRTLVAGFAGGLLFQLIGLPAPWLSGPVVATAAASLAGLELGVPRGVRELALVFFGVSVGAQLKPEALVQLAHWPASLVGLALCVLAIMVGVSLYLEHVHGFDRATARLAAMPGALPYALALTTETKVDARRVVVVQFFRLAALAACLPGIIALTGAAGTLPPVAATARILPHEIALLIAAGIVGDWLFTLLKVPAPALFGALVAGAIATGSGLITTGLPAWLVLPGYLVVGSITGSNFAGTSRREVLDALGASVGAVLVGTLIGLAFAWPVARWLGMPTAQVWLAYSPGGVETMAVIAAALGFDVAFVGAHHVVRFLGLSLAMPIWLREHLVRR